MSDLEQATRTRCARGIVTSCRKGNCTLHVDGLDRDRLTIIDVDRYLPTTCEGQKKPDFFVLTTERGPFCMVVEMKNGKAQARDVEQLQAGSDHLDRLLTEFHNFDVRPLLVHQSMNAIDRKALARRKVTFRGKSLLVQTCRCGDQLERFLV